MSIERSSKYYDNIYLDSEKYEEKPEESRYHKMWLHVIELIPQDVDVVDLGCGTGQFATLFRKYTFGKYKGYDFSKVAIEKANNLELEDCVFQIKDLRKTNLSKEKGFFISLETFEHLNDYDLIKKLGLGREIIFTVPDFNDPSHIRYFHSVNQVVERYKNVIQFELVIKVDRWFICKGVTI